MQLEADMRNSHLVVVSVLYPSKEQICNLLNLLPNCCQMILKTVKQSEWLLALMNNKKVEIQFYEALYSDYLIIDGNVIWYGSQSLVSTVREAANFIRIESKELSAELDANSYTEN